MDFSALTRRDFTRCNPLTNNPVELFGITRRTSRVTRRKSKRDAYFWQRIEFGNSLEIYFRLYVVDPLIKSKLVSLISVIIIGCYSSVP